MIALRLFTASDPSRQVDMRVLGDRDELTIGRDAAAGWALPDPDRALSRLHLKVGVRGGAVSVTDTSTNGVTLGTSDARMPRDESVRVDLGERLEFGPYVVLVERADADARPEPAAAPSAANPFLRDGEAEESPRAPAPDPFASALPDDPLSRPDEDPFAVGRGKGGLGSGYDAPAGGDAWGRRREQRAGDWDAPSAKPAPEAMIGSAPSWRDPEAVQAEGGGFGFDAPFTRPVLQAPQVKTDDLAIPSDWDAPARPAPAPPARPRAASAMPAADEAPPLEAEPPEHDPIAPAPKARPAPRVKAPPASEPPAQAAPAPVADAPASDLLRAFCAGAKLDPAAFASGDPAQTMERLGAVYRHMVLGLGDIMNERTALKSEYRMVRTVVRAQDNNPFKWAPAQRVATELLRPAEEGFLDGPQAVAESFADVKKHLLCMLAGLRAALASTLDLLAPARVEEAVKDQPFVLKTRAAVLWTEYGRLYAQVRSEAQDSADSPANREFRAAYEAQLAELDRMSGR